MNVSYDPSSLLDPFGGYGVFGYILLVIGLWPTLEKAGLPGWGALIPIYNVYLIVKLGGDSGILVLLLAVPLVNIVVLVYVAVHVAEAFGQRALFGFFWLFLFVPIGFLIIGFGASRYQRPRFDAVQ